LRDLQPVQPYLPAQPPGAKRRRGPVVLHEPDVIPPQVDAECLQAAQVELLGVTRLRLEDHLELGVGLQAVGVVAVAGVIRTDAGLDIGDTPGLGTEHAQRRGRVEGSGTDLGIHRLGDNAAIGGPILGQPDQRVLHRQHSVSSSTTNGTARHRSTLSTDCGVETGLSLAIQSRAGVESASLTVDGTVQPSKRAGQRGNGGA
jgi:hypothetical protein